MDLRVDYAFKLFFGTGEPRRLISLLNSIFMNKQIPRIIYELTVVNPSLEKSTIEDKLSTLDIRATLDDGTTACIEMHLYGLIGLKYKSVRSWARAYGEELASGQEYTEQNPVIHISFINGPVTDTSGAPVWKIHSLFHIMERDSHEILLPDLELHYIDMKAFVKYCDGIDENETGYDKFTQWLMVITQKDIKNKRAIRQICSEEEISDAMKTLARLSEDKIKRQAYQRRLDELRSYNHIIRQNEEYRVQIANKDAALADKDTVIAKLMAQLDKSNL